MECWASHFTDLILLNHVNSENQTKKCATCRLLPALGLTGGSPLPTASVLLRRITRSRHSSVTARGAHCSNICSCSRLSTGKQILKQATQMINKSSLFIFYFSCFLFSITYNELLAQSKTELYRKTVPCPFKHSRDRHNRELPMQST